MTAAAHENTPALDKRSTKGKAEVLKARRAEAQNRRADIKYK